MGGPEIEARLALPAPMRRGGRTPFLPRALNLLQGRPIQIDKHDDEDEATRMIAADVHEGWRSERATSARSLQENSERWRGRVVNQEDGAVPGRCGAVRTCSTGGFGDAANWGEENRMGLYPGHKNPIAALGSGPAFGRVVVLRLESSMRRTSGNDGRGCRGPGAPPDVANEIGAGDQGSTPTSPKTLMRERE